MLDSNGILLKQSSIWVDRHCLHIFASNLTKEDKVVLEATTNTWAVYRIISKYTPNVIISNPLRTKAIAEAKIKTDKVDALTLAKLLQSDYIPSVWIPDDRTLSLRKQITHYTSLVQRRTKIKNRIHSVLHQNLIQSPYEDLFSKKGMMWLREILSGLSSYDKEQIACELRLLEQIEREIEKSKNQMAKESYDDNKIKLLMTIPGIDFTTGVCLIGAIGDITRFSTPDKLASYIGIVPRVKQSAEHVWTGRITKQGRRLARWMIIEAAQHVVRTATPLAHFYKRLRNRKGHNIAVVAVARKLAVIIWHMLKRNEPYRYAKPSSLNEKMYKLRRLATDIRKKTGPKQGRTIPRKNITDKKRKFNKNIKEVLAEAGLPSISELSDGEEKYLKKINYSFPEQIV